ncbi:MAG: dienelactone hydrolase family protein [Chloroflexi bacterium]|nr:dienelactone hydrolase family protein [Chloroflexota bacterium]
MPEHSGLHQRQPIRHAGEPLERAYGAMVLLHGRGATAEDILTLASQFDQPNFAYLAPQAKANTWYPNRYLAPMIENEPWLSSALALVEEVLALVQDAGIVPEHTMLLGFSQGACLTLEFAARHARRYGGVVGLTGALIGPWDTPRNYNGTFDGTPIFLGCSNADIHIDKERAIESAEVFKRLGAQVTLRLYPNLGHEVNEDEIDFVRRMMRQIARESRALG